MNIDAHVRQAVLAEPTSELSVNEVADPLVVGC